MGRMFFNYKKNRAWAENLQIITQIGLTMAGCILFGFGIGYYLDKWLGTKVLFIVIFTLLGIAGGGNVVYRQIMEVTEGEKTEAQQEEDNGNNGQP